MCRGYLVRLDSQTSLCTKDTFDTAPFELVLDLYVCQIRHHDHDGDRHHAEHGY